MSKNLFNKLNNLKFNRAFIEIVKNYITTKTLPDDLDKDQKYRIKRRFGKDFTIVDNKLTYTPLNLIVVPTEEKQELLKKLYSDPVMSLGKGVSGFYEKIRSQYLGIKRNDIKEFLSNQEIYQLTRKPKKTINKPILEKKPLGRIAIDLIDMSKYSGHNGKKRYILTLIDYFSKKIAAVGIANKKPETIINALESAFKDDYKGYPKKLQSDRGGEFKNEQVAAYCNQHNIKQIFTTAYTPTANGLIENANLHLRKLIRENFVRTKSLNWIDSLDMIVQSRNESVHTVTKVEPEKAFNDENIQEEIKEKLQNKAESTLKQYKENKFNVGDKVRISTSVLSNKLRQKIKAGEQKDIVINYSTEIYEIVKVSKGRKDFAKDKYYVNGLDKAFYANELIAAKDSESTITPQIEEKLNKVENIPLLEYTPTPEPEKPKRKRKPNPKYIEDQV